MLHYAALHLSEEEDFSKLQGGLPRHSRKSLIYCLIKIHLYPLPHARACFGTYMRVFGTFYRVFGKYPCFRYLVVPTEGAALTVDGFSGWIFTRREKVDNKWVPISTCLNYNECSKSSAFTSRCLDHLHYLDFLRWDILRRS